MRDLELTVEEWPRLLGVSRAGQGISGKEEMEAVPMSVAFVATETMMPGAVLVKLGQDLGRNKASLPMHSDVGVSGKGVPTTWLDIGCVASLEIRAQPLASPY